MTQLLLSIGVVAIGLVVMYVLGIIPFVVQLLTTFSGMLGV